MRTPADLLTLAGHYAAQRRAPPNTIAKELLHYEILFALVQSGAASDLVFQGGTCLRLCYGGSRYSEDLDFAGGADFDPARLARFAEILQEEVANAYGLSVDVRAKTGAVDATVRVDRWQARIAVPQADPSVPQKQVINLEVAAVPSRDPRLAAVHANYEHLRGPLRAIILPVESRREILADKIVALGARSHLKHRDVWDLGMLLDAGEQVDASLVTAKLGDYGLALEEFLEQLSQRVVALGEPEQLAAFHGEMSRFLDAPTASMLARPELCRPFLRRAATIAQSALSALRPRSAAAPGADESAFLGPA